VREPLLRDPGNLDQARKAIERLELTDESARFMPGLTAVLQYLKAAPSANRELYLFSDMRQLSWQRSGEINSALAEAGTLATVFLVRCGTRKLANATIVGLRPEKRIPHENELTGFSVEVRNTGSMPMHQVQVSLAVNGKFKEAESRTIAELPVGQKKAVTLKTRFHKPGLHVLTALLSHDDLPGDNWLDHVVQVREQVKILVVDGTLDLRDPRRSASYYLANALAPVEADKKATHHVQVHPIASHMAVGDLLRDKSVCIFTNVPLSTDLIQQPRAPRPEFLDAVANFVREGKALLIFGGDKVDPEAYNQQLGKRGLLPVGMTAVQAFPPNEPISLERTSADLPAFRHFAQEKFYESLADIPIYQTVGLADPKDTAKTSGAALTVMRYSNGRPAIVTGKIGHGEVMVVGTSADPVFKAGTHMPTWNYLHLWPGYLPLIEASLNHLLHGQAQSYNGQVGDPIHFTPQGALAERSFELIEPGKRDPVNPALLEGQRRPLGPAQKKTDEGRAVVTVGGLSKAGVYYLTTREDKAGDRVPFAMAPDLRERDGAGLEQISEADLNRQLGFTPVHLTVKDGASLDFAAERTHREWTIWLLVVVLLLALAEVVLAWFCGRAW
jgi:hypothetical protein